MQSNNHATLRRISKFYVPYNQLISRPFFDAGQNTTASAVFQNENMAI
jgi:hypothetical protein